MFPMLAVLLKQNKKRERKQKILYLAFKEYKEKIHEAISLEMKHTIAFMQAWGGEGKVEGNKSINKIKQGIKEDGRKGKNKGNGRKT